MSEIISTKIKKQFFVWVIDYVTQTGTVIYLHKNGDFDEKPYRYFKGDDMFPEYYGAKWMRFNEAAEIFGNMVLKNPGKKIQNHFCPYRLVQLQVECCKNLPEEKFKVSWKVNRIIK